MLLLKEEPQGGLVHAVLREHPQEISHPHKSCLKVKTGLHKSLPESRPHALKGPLGHKVHVEDQGMSGHRAYSKAPV